MASSSSSEIERAAADEERAVGRPMSGLESANTRNGSDEIAEADAEDQCAEEQPMSGSENFLRPVFGPFSIADEVRAKDEWYEALLEKNTFRLLKLQCEYASLQLRERASGGGPAFIPVFGPFSIADETRAEDEWYQALYEEDSLRLLKLLRQYASLELWRRGWEGEPDRSENGRRLESGSDETQGQWKGRTALHVGARRGCVKLLRTLCENDSHNDNDLTKLLKSKDGTYEVDAIAMGVVNGNPDVVTLLLEAGYRCNEVKSKYNIQKVQKETQLFLKKWSEAEKEQDGRYREEIRSITRDIIADENSPYYYRFQTEVVGKYDRHLDFNFLPCEEYLLHFLCTGGKETPASPCSVDLDTGIMESGGEIFFKYFLWSQIVTNMKDKPSMPSILEFWWTLKDGQGRAPLHVAVDAARSDMWPIRCAVICLVASLEFTVDKEIVRRIIECLDGAGRTAVHRAFAAGLKISDLEAVCHLLFHLDTELEEMAVWNTQAAHDWIKARTMLLGYGIFNVSPNVCKAVSEEFRNCLERAESDPDSRSLWTSRKHFEYRIDVHSLSKENGFDDVLWAGRTSIHSAIRSSHTNMCTQIMALSRQHRKLSYCDQVVTAILPDRKKDSFSTSTNLPIWHRVWHQGNVRQIHVDTIGFAALIVKKATDPKFGFLLNFYKENKVRAKKKDGTACFPTVAIVAARGEYNLLQSTIDAKLDALKEDHMKNMALHYAFQGKNIPFGYCMDLLSFTNCYEIKMFKSFEKNSNNNKNRSSPCEEILEESSPLEKMISKFIDRVDKDRAEKNQSEKDFVEAQGCINLLLQQGCDVFKPNDIGQVPYPNNDADPKLFAWWHEKQAKEFTAAQSAQNAAANAISVTAALVATASYVGPLQPPLGYSENDPTQLRLDIMAVKIFIICDTLSFYLAITAIIFALVPCLPMPQQPMDAELRRTRRMVNAAVTVLFPSIICVLVAFAAGSIAVVQTNQITWNWGGVTPVTVLIGGFFCMFAIIIFTIRLLRIILHRSTWINKLYVATSF